MNQTENVTTSWFISIQQFLKYFLIIILFDRINVNQFAKFQCVFERLLDKIVCSSKIKETRFYMVFFFYHYYYFFFITFCSHIIFNLTNKHKILSVLPYAGSSIFFFLNIFYGNILQYPSFWGILFTLIIISYTCILSILISTIPS